MNKNNHIKSKYMIIINHKYIKNDLK